MQFKGKTVDDAIKQALLQLNEKEENVEIIILEQPKKGFFGRLKGEAVVDVVVKEKITQTKEEVKEQPKKVKDEKKKVEKNEKKEVKETKKTEKVCNTDNSEKTIEFVQNVLDLLDIDAVASKKFADNKLIISLESKDSSALIGRHGELLDAVQTLAGAVENIGNKVYKKVVVDCENYRGKREDALVNLAKKLETKATEMKREVILEPMSPYERRIIHTALAESETVKTESRGKEPNRFVVIVPNELDEFSKPYNAGRNNDRRGGGNGKRGFNNKGGDRRPRNNDRRGSSSFSSAPRKKSSFTFGTYLGNSMKDKD